MPFRLGMPMSMTVTSGRSDFAMETASLPSPASPTTERSVCCSIRRRSPLRMSLWSSARSIRIFLIRSRGFCRVQWKFRLHRGTLSGPGFDRQSTAEPLHALFHSQQPHAPHAPGIKAQPVVDDLDPEFFRCLNDGNTGVFGGVVGCRVVDRFLHQTIDTNFGFVG